MLASAPTDESEKLKNELEGLRYQIDEEFDVVGRTKAYLQHCLSKTAFELNISNEMRSVLIHLVAWHEFTVSRRKENVESSIKQIHLKLLTKKHEAQENIDGRVLCCGHVFARWKVLVDYKDDTAKLRTFNRIFQKTSAQAVFRQHQQQLSQSRPIFQASEISSAVPLPSSYAENDRRTQRSKAVFWKPPGNPEKGPDGALPKFSFEHCHGRVSRRRQKRSSALPPRSGNESSEEPPVVMMKNFVRLHQQLEKAKRRRAITQRRIKNSEKSHQWTFTFADQEREERTRHLVGYGSSILFRSIFSPTDSQEA